MNTVLEKILGSENWFMRIQPKIPLPIGRKDVMGVQDYILGILQTLIALGGLAAVCFIVYGAYLFILSSGDPDAAGKAQRVITNAIIGLVLAAISFMVINYIITITA